jgi:hypothetical protein
MKTGMFSGFAQKGLTQWLLPPLDPKEAAVEIVASIRREDAMLIIPRAFSVMLALTSFLPVEWTEFATDRMGGLNLMDHFQGRGLDWAMKKLD